MLESIQIRLTISHSEFFLKPAFGYALCNVIQVQPTLGQCSRGRSKLRQCVELELELGNQMRMLLQFLLAPCNLMPTMRIHSSHGVINGVINCRAICWLFRTPLLYSMRSAPCLTATRQLTVPLSWNSSLNLLFRTLHIFSYCLTNGSLVREIRSIYLI